eukprot:COSAG04_NODE_17836_length_457_cov_1.525140_1_plen_41_part_10
MCKEWSWVPWCASMFNKNNTKLVELLLMLSRPLCRNFSAFH